MKSEKMTGFALAVAAVALLIVGAMSYRDYLRAKYEKEFGVPPSTRTPASPGVNAQYPDPSATRVAAVDALPPARAPEPHPAAAPASETPAAPATPAAPGPGTGVAAAPPPAAPAPAISQYQQSLAELRQESQLYQQKLEEARRNTADTPGSGPLVPSPSPSVPSAPATPPAPIPGIDPAFPDSAVAAVPGSPATPAAPAPSPTGNPGGAPPQPPSPAQIDREVNALAEKVRKEASIAKVIEYDPNWAFLVLDGGRDRGIEYDMRFAVRRGGEILGWIKVTEVEANRSVAQLMSANKDSATARKPQRGDEIIAFNLF